MRAHFRLRQRPPSRRRLVVLSVLLALLLHAGVLAFLLLVDPGWRFPSHPPVQITFVEPLSAPTPEGATAETPVPEETPAEGTEVGPEADVATRSGRPPGGGVPGGGGQGGTGGPGNGPDIAVATRDHMDAEVHKRLSTPPTRDHQARDGGRIGTPTDSIDGVGRVGSGRPGDPRIPGSGGVDIGKVVGRDAVVKTAKVRAEEGVIHPFIARMKREIERGWKPTAADVRALRNPQSIPDNVCAKGQHDRYLVARVFAVYDADGTPMDLHIDGATISRNIRTRIESAVRVMDVRGQIPPELVTEAGTLRLAWNVYLDDYTGCGLVGKGASGTARGWSYVVGVVELDGAY